MHHLLAIAIGLDVLALTVWLVYDAPAAGVWGSPLAVLPALLAAQALRRLGREYGLSGPEVLAWGMLLVAAYPLGIAVLALAHYWPNLSPTITGAALCAVLMFPLAQIAGLVAFNARLRAHACTGAGRWNGCAT
jgi:hypothetical protein